MPLAERAGSPGKCIVEHNPERVKLYGRETAMEPTPKKRLDRLRACTAEGAEVTPSASRAVAGQCKRYAIRTACPACTWAAGTGESAAGSDS
jgi:hypothetical protein